MKKDDWISATEVATFVYCPEAWRLRHGLKLKSANQPALKAGENRHERWQKIEKRSTWLIRGAVIYFLLVALLWLLRRML